MRIAKMLLVSYPDMEYWHVFEPKWKPDSLVYYLSAKGKKELEEFFNGDAGREAVEKKQRQEALEIPQKETYNLQTHSVVTGQMPQKPKTLRDFLKE